ncbi:MAG TPA: efflux RND transporter periplasmic adaptor subunit [Terriglobales bacterium]
MTNKLVIAGLCLLLTLSGCNRKSDSGEDTKGDAAAVPDVTVTKVTRAPIAEDLIVSGNLAAPPNHDAKVAALVPGRISRVFVTEGSPVKEGQVLAELDTTLLQEQQRQAEAAVAQARASAENSKLALQREESLLGRGVSSRKEVEDARTQVAVNNAALNNAEAGLATAKAQIARAHVRAPFSGTVVKRFAGVGEQVDGTAAQPIVEVAQIDTLELMGTVPAARLNEIKAGQAFEFNAPDSGHKIRAKVAAILPAVDPATNNGTVRIQFENPNHELKLGQYLTLELPLKGSGPRLVVPKQAIYPDESGEPHVYKINGDEAESVAVRVGIQTKEKAEILSGVGEGDTLILTGGYGLPEKAKVHVKQ